LKQEFLVGLRLGVAAEDEGAAVGGREVGIDHLDGGKLVEYSPGGETRSVGPQAGAEGDVKAIGEEGDKDAGLDAGLALVVDGAQIQVVLEIFESRFDFSELDVKVPKFGRVLGGRGWSAAGSGLRGVGHCEVFPG